MAEQAVTESTAQDNHAEMAKQAVSDPMDMDRLRDLYGPEEATRLHELYDPEQIERRKAANEAEAIGRSEVAKGVTDFILEPLAALAGVLAAVPKEAEYGMSVKQIVNLVGLVVRGARAELALQVHGGDEAAFIRSMTGEMLTVEV